MTNSYSMNIIYIIYIYQTPNNTIPFQIDGITFESFKSLEKFTKPAAYETVYI